MSKKNLIAGLTAVALLGGTLVVLAQDQKQELTDPGPSHHPALSENDSVSTCRARFRSELSGIAAAVKDAKADKDVSAKADATLGIVGRLAALLGDGRTCVGSSMGMSMRGFMRGPMPMNRTGTGWNCPGYGRTAAMGHSGWDCPSYGHPGHRHSMRMHEGMRGRMHPGMMGGSQSGHMTSGPGRTCPGWND